MGAQNENHPNREMQKFQKNHEIRGKILSVQTKCRSRGINCDLKMNLSLWGIHFKIHEAADINCSYDCLIYSVYCFTTGLNTSLMN